MYLTIRKEVQTRFCRITVHPDGSARLTAFADNQPYIAEYAFDSVAQAREHADLVQLGGVTHWSKTGSNWESDRVLCFQGGIRLNPAECELVRQQSRKRNGAPR